MQGRRNPEDIRRIGWAGFEIGTAASSFHGIGTMPSVMCCWRDRVKERIVSHCFSYSNGDIPLFTWDGRIKGAYFQIFFYKFVRFCFWRNFLVRCLGLVSLPNPCFQTASRRNRFHDVTIRNKPPTWLTEMSDHNDILLITYLFCHQ